MSRPLRLTICNQSFKIDWKELGEGTAGLCHVSKQLLEISTQLAPNQEKDTVLHELLHAALEIMGHSGSTLNKRQEEAIVMAISYAIINVMRDNPHLVTWITED